MQAIRLTKESSADAPSIKIEEVAIPQADDNHALVKIKAAAIQPADRLNAKGGFGSTKFPRIPGRDFAGVVVDGTKELKDKEVFGTGGAFLGFSQDGTHAEYCLVHKDMVAEKPASLTFVQAAAIGVPFTTALLCLRRARVSSDDTVLIIGSTGSVGSAAVQIARALGAKKVFGAARRDSADVNTASDPTLSKLKDLTDGRGVDIVVDTVGGVELMSAAVGHLAQRGRYTWIAAPRGSGAATDYSMNLLDTYRRELEFIGCNSAAVRAVEVGADLDKISSLFADGKLQGPGEDTLEQVSLSDGLKTFIAEQKLQIITFS